MLSVELISSVELEVGHFHRINGTGGTMYKIERVVNLQTLRSTLKPLKKRKKCFNSVPILLIKVQWASLQIFGVGHCQ